MGNKCDLVSALQLSCLGEGLSSARKQILQPVFSGNTERFFVHRNANLLPLVELLVANQIREYRCEGKAMGYSGNIENGDCHLLIAEGNLDSHYCPDFFLCDVSQIRAIPLRDVVSYSHL